MPLFLASVAYLDNQSSSDPDDYLLLMLVPHPIDGAVIERIGYRVQSGHEAILDCDSGLPSWLVIGDFAPVVELGRMSQLLFVSAPVS